MATPLYPLTFKTIFKDKIWGGTKIRDVLHKNFAPLPNCGETWELSGVKGNLSFVANGLLQGKTLPELIDEYKGELVGNKVYKQHGTDFPLLIKYIDAAEDLSIQVHPDDTLAKKRHNSFGKTEMWYIMQADEDATLIAGFNQDLTKEAYLDALNSGRLTGILNEEKVDAGDTFFLPAGRVHTIGKGLLLAEIQQTSDVTYRIYDFDRVDDQGNKRELHTELALDALDFSKTPDAKTHYKDAKNEAVTLVSCPYFTTNKIKLDQTLDRDHTNRDSFVIYIGTEGVTELKATTDTVSIGKGEVYLVPARLTQVTLVPQGEAELLEVYV